jgi:hypothetical protein
VNCSWVIRTQESPFALPAFERRSFNLDPAALNRLKFVSDQAAAGYLFTATGATRAIFRTDTAAHENGRNRDKRSENF